MSENRYVIRGGIPGRERLRLLSRVMRPTTLGLIQQLGLRSGLRCLDFGCGGGDVAFELARIVGSSGQVVGVDLDQTKLDLARSEAEAQQLGNVEFRRLDVAALDLAPEFDVAYGRFLLGHLNDPRNALTKVQKALRPGGIVAIEDVDFTGHFCYPDCKAFSRYVELYTEVLRRAGGDANVGPRLPGMLLDLGFERVGMNVVQPAGIEGEVKIVSPLTMENVADSILAAGLASRAELDQVIRELYEFARDPRTVMSITRVVQAWGYRAAS